MAFFNNHRPRFPVNRCLTVISLEILIVLCVSGNRATNTFRKLRAFSVKNTFDTFGRHRNGIAFNFEHTARNRNPTIYSGTGRFKIVQSKSLTVRRQSYSGRESGFGRHQSIFLPCWGYRFKRCIFDFCGSVRRQQNVECVFIDTFGANPNTFFDKRTNCSSICNFISH